MHTTEPVDTWAAAGTGLALTARPAAPPDEPPPIARVAPVCLVYLVGEYPAISETFVLREVRALRDRGVAVRVIAIRRPDRLTVPLTPAEAEEAEAAAYVLGSGWLTVLRAHAVTLWRHPWAYLRALWLATDARALSVRRSVRRLLYFGEAMVVGDMMRRGGEPHVHAHFSTQVAHLVARVFPVTYSATIHGPLVFENGGHSEIVERVHAATFVRVTNRYMQSQLMLHCPQQLWERIVNVRLGIDCTRYRPTVPRAARDGSVAILCVARLAPAKGHVVLLEAFARLCTERCNVRLHLVGDGPLRTSLVEFVRARGLEDMVVFHGACNEDEVRALYASADIFALASFAEGQPVALMEAMAARIPCVASRVAGVPELIRDGVDGLLVTPADASELAAALRRLIDDGALRAEMGRAGESRVTARHQLGAQAEALSAVFRQHAQAEPPHRTR